MSDKPVFNNFDLHIGQRSGDAYPIGVLYSPAGETADPAWVTINPDERPMHIYLQHLKKGTIAHKDLLALGRQLTSCLLPPGRVRDLYQRSLGMADAKHERLRLRLRISPPELAALPWEYTYDDDIDDFFVMNSRTVLVRYHGQPTAPRSVASRAPVPILGLVSNPLHIPHASPLETAREVRRLVKALKQLMDKDQVKLDVLFSGSSAERQDIESVLVNHTGSQLLPQPATIDALRDCLRQGYRVIHYIGHGVFDEDAGGALLLTDDESQSILIGAQTLARELRGASAAVVVLNACESATESTTQAFMGLAPSLIRAEVPAVVAMQYAIQDSSAIRFSHALYKALADGWPLDAAVTEGRKAISVGLAEESADWGIPVVFMRSPDGVIWQEEEKMDEQTTASPQDSSQRSGGVNFYGSAKISGDVVGRDKNVYGGEVRGDKVAGDKIEGHVGNVGAGAQVAIGKQIRQTSVQTTTRLTPSERAAIIDWSTVLKHQLANADISEHKKIAGQEFVNQLEDELTKTEEPADGSIIKAAGEWLLKNVPALAGTLMSMFASPIVSKVVEAAGEIATEWVKKRFSLPG